MTLQWLQVRELVSELGVDVELAGTAVIDHFGLAAGDAAHTTVLGTGFVDSKAVFGGRTPVRVTTQYRGSQRLLRRTLRLKMTQACGFCCEKACSGGLKAAVLLACRHLCCSGASGSLCRPRAPW